MVKQTNSIQLKLIKWLVIILILFSICLTFFIYAAINKKINDFFNNRLLAIAKSIEDNLGIINGKIIANLPKFSIELFSNFDKGLIYYSVIDEDENLILGHQFLFDKTKITNGNVSFFDTKYNGSFLKAVTFTTYFYSSAKKHKIFITVAETTEERVYNINEIIKFILISISVASLFIIYATIFAVQEGIKPLVKLKRIIKKRDKFDLEPIIFNAPKEIEDVVNSINILLKRSKDTVKYIEQFNSDVSHQLRTPLSELKVKLELLFDKNNIDYIKLNALINNMKHIIEQLLLYAKTNPSTINYKRFQKICLNDTCRLYSIKTAPRVYSKGFEFAFDDLKEKIFIKADSILIESMLDNLINNSIHYAVDKNNNPIGTITISIEKNYNSIWLNVKDEGTGIDDKYMKDIFKRYYRVDSKKAGTGLGLSIVKQIATLHNAKVLAKNDKGLKISIIFNIN